MLPAIIGRISISAAAKAAVYRWNSAWLLQMNGIANGDSDLMWSCSRRMKSVPAATAASISAQAAHFVQISGEAESIGDEATAKLGLPHSLEQRPRGGIERVELAVDRHGLEPHLKDGHHVGGPRQGRKPHLVAPPRAGR